MNVNLITSKTNNLCLYEIFEILKKRDKSKKHIILAPDRCLFSLEEKLFEYTGESCFFDVDIISLSRLSKKFLSSSNKRVLTKQSGVALIKKLLLENKDKLKTFRKSIEYIGFAETLFETICLYKSCNIRPQDMYVNESENYANFKQSDIKLIYTLYEEYLQKDYTDSLNQLQIFANNIDKKTFENTCFYFVEYEDFTSIMYDIIIKLCRFSDETYITCTYGKDNNNSNIYSNKVYNDLRDIFNVNGLEYKTINVENYKNKSLSLMANNLFAFDIKKHEDCECVYINAFNNIEDEVKYTIADIYSRCIESGKNFSNFGIVLPSLTEYKNILTIELDKYDIPYYFDESQILGNHIIPRMVFDILNIITDSFNLPEFVGVIKSAIWGFNKNSVCIYDNYLKQNGVISYHCLNSETLNDIEINQFLDYLREWKEKIKDCNTNFDYLNVVSEILNFIKIKADKYYESLNALKQRVFTQVLNKFDNINQDFNNVFGGLENTVEDFVVTFKSYFESTTISLPPISSNTIFIADINSSYISEKDYIYILGCNEGRLPKFSLDNGLVTDDEIARLPNAKKINPTIKMINNRKLFKLFETSLKFKEKIILSYLLSNNEGSLYPNTLITSFLKLFDIKVNYASSALDTINKSFYKLDTNNIVFNNLNERKILENNLEYIKNWDVYKDNINYRKLVSTLYYQNSEDNKRLFENYNKSTLLPNIKGASFFKDNTTSISQIESYFNCPYKHYIRYGIKLKDSINAKIKPSDVGTIIHEVLKGVLPLIIKNKNDIDYLIKYAINTLDKVLQRDENKTLVQNISNKYIIKSLHGEIERIVKDLINYVTYSNFKPKYYEFRFNSDDFKISDIKITGAIDRVDVYDNNFLIIDYKTGNSDFSDYSEVLSGKKLQLLVYSKIFANKFKMQPAGAFYHSLSNTFTSTSNKNMLTGVILKDDNVIKNIDTRLIDCNASSDIVNLKTTKEGNMYSNNYYKYMCLDGDDFDYLLDFALKQVKLAIDDILKGEISAHPLKDSNWSACTYCDYRSICGYLENNDNLIKHADTIDSLKI